MTHLVMPLIALPDDDRDALAAWVAMVGAADEACLVLDRSGCIAGVSPAAVGLLSGPVADRGDGGEGRNGASEPDGSARNGWYADDPTLTTRVPGLVGRAVLDGIALVDFSARHAPLPEREADRIPPLVAARSGALARGLMRVRHRDGTSRTLDAVSTPLHRNGRVAGSLTFLAEV